MPYDKETGLYYSETVYGMLSSFREGTVRKIEFEGRSRSGKSSRRLLREGFQLLQRLLQRVPGEHRAFDPCRHVGDVLKR